MFWRHVTSIVAYCCWIAPSVSLQLFPLYIVHNLLVCGIRFWLEDWGWQIESGAGWQYNGLPIASFGKQYIAIHLRITGHLQFTAVLAQQWITFLQFGIALRLLILFFRAPGRSRETNQTVLHREIFLHTSHFTEYSPNLNLNWTIFYMHSLFDPDTRQLIKNISMEYF